MGDPKPGGGSEPGRSSASSADGRFLADLDQLEALVREQRVLSDGLVLLHAIAATTLERSVAKLETVLKEHQTAFGAWTSHRRFPGPDARVADLVRGDHGTFFSSIDQLHWLLGIVRRDDHGGNRQALGQYWRVLLEAMGRHSDDERTLVNGSARSRHLESPPPGPQPAGDRRRAPPGASR